MYRRRIVLEPGKTISLVVGGGGAPPAAAGWLRVQAPIALDIRGNGRLLGRSDADRLMIPAGDHLFEFSNRAAGFQTQQRVRIAPDATSAIRVAVPSVPVNVNAQPWAEVWVDNVNGSVRHRLPITCWASVPVRSSSGIPRSA